MPVRKFLIAGRGGLNLTHSGTVEQLLAHYDGAQDWLRPYLRAFDGDLLRTWADDLGAETFVGTSGRVFPKTLKAARLLRAWLARLDALGVTLKLRTRLIGMAAGPRFFLHGADGASECRPNAAILALGGASWPRLGSDGTWTEMLRSLGIAVAPLEPANVGMLVPWSAAAAARLTGAPLKNLRAWVGDHGMSGELMLTAYGIEGQLVYAQGRHLRAELNLHGRARLCLDLKPERGLEDLIVRLARPRGSKSWSNWLTGALRLPASVPVLLREVGIGPASTIQALARTLKCLPLTITGTRPITEAISSAGGVRRSEVDGQLMLLKAPGVFVAGEMLDWEAPTGGYLLQAAFATGAAAAAGVIDWLDPVHRLTAPA